ncbi:MAG: hypothetical protein HY880_09370 [Deltaproteobacteria bacterium]|nr:hypothetical protein [Deltaproteobacteria bacterium]
MAKEDFLKLLGVQLQYQDPLSPMENTEFVAQMAQFSTLEGITNMSDSMELMAAQIMSMNNLYASSLIGKEVKTYGNTVSLGADGNVDLSYYLQSDAATVEVSVRDSSGNLVRTIDTANASAGANSIVWDGRDSNGNMLPPGDYVFSVDAKASNGAPVAADTIVSGVVSGIVYVGGVPFVMIGETKVPLSNVLEIWTAEDTTVSKDTVQGAL